MRTAISQLTRYVLDNGLTVLLLPDTSTKMVALCMLYKVGSRNETQDTAGIAHLFEHLMFSNCEKDIDFDEVLQSVGGESNAFTSPDTTQFYNIVPAHQLELVLCLESQRLNGYKVNKKDFLTQQSIVIEEFSEHYLNNPYGLFSHHLFRLAYQKHPYQWPVIGNSREQLAAITIDHTRQFFDQYYTPSNLILVVHGNVDVEECRRLISKYFGKIKGRRPIQQAFTTEPKIENIRKEVYHGQWPENAFYYAFHCCKRKDPDFYALDFLTDILAEGKSSMLYARLKKDRMLFSTIDCYLTATSDPGLIIVEAKLNNKVQMQEAESAFWEVINELQTEPISDHVWEKYQNKNESAYLFSQLGLVNRALNLSYAEWLGDPELIYNEIENYRKISKEDIMSAAEKYFTKNAHCALYYQN